MNAKKIIGWFLLTVGLVIIFWTLYSSYNIFTKKSLAPEVFKITEEEDSAFRGGKTQPSSPEEFQEEMKKIIEEQMKEIVPSEFLATFLNLISWSIFAGILIFGGSRISGIGIKLIKKQ